MITDAEIRAIVNGTVGAICKQLGVSNLGELAMTIQGLKDTVARHNADMATTVDAKVDAKVTAALTAPATIATLINELLKNPKLMSGVIANLSPKDVSTLGRLVAASNREFYSIVDEIRRLLGPEPAKDCDRQIFAVANRAMAEEIGLASIGELIEREQNNGNLPKPAPVMDTQEPSQSDSIKMPDVVLAPDKTAVLGWLEQLIKPEAREPNMAALASLVTNFIRRGDATRTAAKLYQAVKDKFGEDIFAGPISFTG